ncbi:hypothetical protein JCM9279_006042 [Rhodotorula babjevae]
MRRTDAQQALRALHKVIHDQVHLPWARKDADQLIESIQRYISSPELAKAPAARCSTSTATPAISSHQAEREERTTGRLHTAATPPTAPAPEAAPAEPAPTQAQWQQVLGPVLARLTAIEAAVASPNRFAALPIEEASDGNKHAASPSGSYAAAAARTTPCAAPPRAQPAAAPPQAAARAALSHRPEAVILRNAANDTPERLLHATNYAVAHRRTRTRADANSRSCRLAVGRNTASSSASERGSAEAAAAPAESDESIEVEVDDGVAGES